VQANAGDTLKYAVLAKVFYGLRYAIVFRNASTISSYLRSPLQKWLYSVLLRRVSYVASVSDRSLRDFISVFPFIESRIQHIGNGIDFRDLPERRIFNSAEKHLVHVGGFTFEKNHEGLLRIFARVRREVTNVRLWLVGDGNLVEKTRLTARQLGIDSQVEFVGARMDALSFITSADAMLLPSIIEGLPAVIVEAFYCRTPVVAYDVGGISEVVKDGITGCLVPSGDEDRFASVVIKLLGDPRDLAVEERAHDLVIEKFDNRQIASKFLELYQHICE
jgi:glycosyltransferase involved in cell wall biosynthesis